MMVNITSKTKTTIGSNAIVRSIRVPPRAICTQTHYYEEESTICRRDYQGVGGHALYANRRAGRYRRTIRRHGFKLAQAVGKIDLHPPALFADSQTHRTFAPDRG